MLKGSSLWENKEPRMKSSQASLPTLRQAQCDPGIESLISNYNNQHSIFNTQNPKTKNFEPQTKLPSPSAPTTQPFQNHASVGVVWFFSKLPALFSAQNILSETDLLLTLF